MSDQQVRIVLSASAQGFPAAAGAAEGGLNRVGAAATRTTTRLQQTVTETQRMQRQLALVTPQLTDIFVSLGSGQAPLTVLLQQGGQLRDLFGSWGGAARAVAGGLASMLGPVTAVAGGVAAFVAAAVAGWKESNNLRDSIALTGNYASITEGQFNELVDRVATATKSTAGAVREMAEGLVSSGRVSGAALEDATTAAVNMARATGKSAEDVVSFVVDMSKNVATALERQNEQWHFATGAQIEHVRQTEITQGKQAALVEAMVVLNGHLKTQTENIGYLEAAWRAATLAYGRYKEMALGIGRDVTVEDRLQALNAQLAENRRAQAGMSSSWDGASITAAKREETALLRQVRDLEIEIRDGRMRAGNRGYNAQQEEDRTKRLKALAEVTGSLTGANTEYIKSLKTIQASAAAGDITEAQRLQMLTELAVKYGAAAGKAPKPRASSGPKDPLGAFMDDQLNAARVRDDAAAVQAARTLTRMNEQAADFGGQLYDQAQQLNIDLITSDRERGLMQIALERSTLQARIDEMAAGGADVRLAQDGLNEYVLARQRQLTEQLKPEWQRMLEGWRDTTQLMADTYNTAMSRMVSEGETQWLNLVKNGQLNMRGLVDIVMEEQARLTYRNLIAPAASKGFDWLLGAAGITAQGGKGPSGSSANSWEQDFGALTAGLQKSTLAIGDNAQMLQRVTAGLGGFGDMLMSAAQAVLTLASSASGSSGGGGFLSSIFSLFGSSTSTTAQSLTDMGSSTVGMSLAVGTNRLPADGWKYLHRDEAVVPAKFNPWAGGTGLGGGVTINSPITFNGSGNSAQDQVALERLLDQRDAILRAQITQQLARPGSAAYNAARR